MIEDLIDRNEDFNQGTLYSKIAAGLGLASLVIIAALFKLSESLNFEDKLVMIKCAVTLVICFTIVGFVASMISFYAQEQSSLHKSFGAISNLAVLFYLVFTVMSN